MLYDFLRKCSYRGQELMLNGACITNECVMMQQLSKAEVLLKAQAAPKDKISVEVRSMRPDTIMPQLLQRWMLRRCCTRCSNWVSSAVGVTPLAVRWTQCSCWRRSSRCALRSAFQRTLLAGAQITDAQAPDNESLEEFLSRVPNTFSIALTSVHGYFGQSDCLGKPDTGGQVRTEMRAGRQADWRVQLEQRRVAPSPLSPRLSRHLLTPCT